MVKTWHHHESDTEQIFQLLLPLSLPCQNNNNFTQTFSHISCFLPRPSWAKDPDPSERSLPRSVLSDSIFGAGVLKNGAVVLAGIAGAAFLLNPDCSEVPVRKLSSPENLALKYAGPGIMFPDAELVL